MIFHDISWYLLLVYVLETYAGFRPEGQALLCSPVLVGKYIGKWWSSKFSKRDHMVKRMRVEIEFNYRLNLNLTLAYSKSRIAFSGRFNLILTPSSFLLQREVTWYLEINPNLIQSICQEFFTSTETSISVSPSPHNERTGGKLEWSKAPSSQQLCCPVGKRFEKVLDRLRQGYHWRFWSDGGTSD